MKNALLSLNSVIVLSGAAFLCGIARLMLDMRFVPEIASAMPEAHPEQVAGVMIFFLVLYGGWLWALLASARNSQRGLIALFLFNFVGVFIWGMATLVVFCPTPCPVVAPLTDIVTWSNVIIGLIATLATGAYLYFRSNRNDFAR